ncbi:MAG: DNA-directed RNA polymerase subunit beta', partial [Alphaproteobacteria bacterium]
MEIPAKKGEFVEGAQKAVQEIENQYTEGLITDGERYNKVIDIWSRVAEDLEGELMSEIGTDVVRNDKGEERRMPSFNPIFIMADSGARGSRQQIKQLAGMRGLMAKPSGEIIETPITANFREGLSVLQYFISTHGARKGLADTALKTANSGYLTRRLVDVAQDSVVTEFDCGTLDGIEIETLVEAGEVIEPLGDRILGRVALEDIVHPHTEAVIVATGDEIDESKVTTVNDSPIRRVKVRSPLTCQTKRGVCMECYGRDLARGHKVNIGESVGVIAAQSIGEPGTQLTMRTFHIGGIASGRAVQSTLEARSEGRLKYLGLNTIKKGDGTIVVM